MVYPITCIYDFKRVNVCCFVLKLYMLEGVLRLAHLGLEGSRNNWFGLGCPTYCSQPSFAVYLLIFLSGILLGLGLAGLLLWTLWTWLVPQSVSSTRPHQSPSSRYSALAEYAYEQGPSRRRPH